MARPVGAVTGCRGRRRDGWLVAAAGIVVPTMTTAYARLREASDPYCLRPGEAGRLLAGHPYRRFIAIGDSVAQGIGEPVEGYVNLPWADRVAAELREVAPDLEYLNLAQRDMLATQVRATQVAPALAFAPDLALISCGGNDALRASYRPDEVDEQLIAIIEPLHAAGADIVTIGMFDTSSSFAIRPAVKPQVGRRMRMLAYRTRLIAARFNAMHVYVVGHPLEATPEQLFATDGIHGNMRSHAICATENIRLIGQRLGNTFDETSRPRVAPSEGAPDQRE
jgi:lysophospholipase L1-like esterase